MSADGSKVSSENHKSQEQDARFKKREKEQKTKRLQTGMKCCSLICFSMALAMLIVVTILYWQLFNGADRYNKENPWDETPTFGPATEIEPYDACGLSLY